MSETDRINSWDYDAGSDTIYFSGDNGVDYKYSLRCGDTTFDVDKFGNIIGVSIRDASKRLNIPREAFEDMKSLKVLITVIDDNNIHLRIESQIETEPFKAFHKEYQIV